MNVNTQNFPAFIQFHKNGKMTFVAEKINFAKKLYES